MSTQQREKLGKCFLLLPSEVTSMFSFLLFPVIWKHQLTKKLSAFFSQNLMWNPSCQEEHLNGYIEIFYIKNVLQFLLLYNILFSRALYFHANSRIRQICENKAIKSSPFQHTKLNHCSYISLLNLQHILQHISLQKHHHSHKKQRKLFSDINVKLCSFKETEIAN